MVIAEKEQHSHANGFQFPGIGDSVQNVAGEPADLLSENQAEPAHLCVQNHPVECISLFGAGPGDAFVGVNLVKAPNPAGGRYTPGSTAADF